MKKKGFTLIELLAVIVILAIIVLIATPIILSVIEKAKQGSAEQSAIGYINGIENSIIISELKDNTITDGSYNVLELESEVKGEKPSSGNVTIEKGIVVDAVLCISNYKVSYSNNKAEVKGKCEKETLFKVGDYVKMTPTKTSYIVNSTETGWKDSPEYSSDDVIYPSELNLWRVIKISDVGNIEIVSENVSSTNVHFYGLTGYLNLVGALNEIASQYKNSKYTTGSRIIGYDGQIEKITDISKFTIEAPLTSSTSDSSNEILGGGDMLYETDTNLVKTALKTLVATKPSETTATKYWLGSRLYGYSNSANFVWYGRYVTTNGAPWYGANLYAYGGGGWKDYVTSMAIRPILTLKSGLIATGSGTSDDPWVLE